MSPAIHIELNALCLIMLCTIAYQSRESVNQQKDRILFRNTAYGNIILLILDILWVLIEGRVFPGAVAANKIINALFLGGGVVIGCFWYMYVLETLGHRVTRRIQALVMLPGVIFMLLNLLSIKTGWIFTVSPENVYSHASLFWLQSLGAYGMLVLSFLHILLSLFRTGENRSQRRDIYKLLKFYIIPVIGSIVSLFETGMPGTWTSAAVSIVLIYLDEQNRDMLHGMITAISTNYRSIYYAKLDEDECTCVRGNVLYGDMREGKVFSFRGGFQEYADNCVAEEDKASFMEFVDPAHIRAGLSHSSSISHHYLTVRDGAEEYEMLTIADVRDPENRDDHGIEAIGAGFSNVDRETRKSMAQNRALTEALTRAEEANAAKTAFLSSMSHEIRTPMNAIIGLDRIALQDPGLSPRTRDTLEKIGSSAQHLLAIINDILDMSRIESGRMELKREVFSFREVVKQVSIIINGQCEDKGLSFIHNATEVPDDYFIGDDLRLRQMLINILGNSVKFTDAPGWVRFVVDIQPDGNSDILRFTISDNGIGMDADFLPHLFDAFAQENNTSTNRYGGSGLGMAITRNMIDLMGGRIDVESEKGRGSTFKVEIPVIRAQKTPEIPVEQEDVALAGLHILIVEDVELNAEILQDMLEMEDITSEWAQNGQAAVERFEDSDPGHFSAILMDMRMPVMDGLAATEAIRNIGRPDAKTIPIIALTANAFEEDVKQCLQAGMNAHLSKPVDIGELKKTLGKLIEAAPGAIP